MKAGNVYQAGSNTHWTAAIEDGTWHEKIRVFGETEDHARALRDRILVALDRRDPNFAMFHYTKARDPRIRILERRKS